MARSTPKNFEAYVEKSVGPQPHGQAIWRSWTISAAIKAKPSVGRSAAQPEPAKLFFLPKYSPDFNPIEQVFAKLKHLLRKAAARTIETVVAAIGERLDTFTPQECANYLANAGYR